MGTELRHMVEAVAVPLELLATGDLTATDPTDTDSWGLPGEPVTIYDWVNAFALEVYAEGRWSPTTGEWTATDWTVATTLGGPDIRVTVSLTGGRAWVDGAWGGETVTVSLGPDAADELVILAEASLPPGV